MACHQDSRIAGMSYRVAQQHLRASRSASVSLSEGRGELFVTIASDLLGTVLQLRRDSGGSAAHRAALAIVFLGYVLRYD